MPRTRLTVACLAVLMAAAVPAAAQTFRSTPVVTDASQAPLALPRAQPAIPAPQDRPYPGVIQYRADITDRDRRIISVTETIPVAGPGPLTLLYPKYLPGNHSPSGPIQLVAGLVVSAGGERVAWTRDPVDPYAFHIDVPEGVTTLDVAFDWLTQPDGGAWRVVMTPEIVNLQFDKALLYPAGYPQSRIRFETSVRLPAGWNYGVALDTAGRDGDVVRFAPVV